MHKRIIWYDKPHLTLQESRKTGEKHNGPHRSRLRGFDLHRSLTLVHTNGTPLSLVTEGMINKELSHFSEGRGPLSKTFIIAVQLTGEGKALKFNYSIYLTRKPVIFKNLLEWWRNACSDWLQNWGDLCISLLCPTRTQWCKFVKILRLKGLKCFKLSSFLKCNEN